MHDVVLPVLNEARAIPWVLGRIPAQFRAIVVDNGSTDGSGEIAERCGAQVVSEPRRGFGAACYAGLVASTSSIVAFMDCDGSLDPRELDLVARPIAAGDADLVLGRRERAGIALHARVGNAILARAVRRSTGVSLRDIGPMRAARRSDLLSLGIEDRRFGWPLEMVVRAARVGWRIREVPVTYGSRTGRSKVTGTVRGTLKTVRDMAAVLR